MDLADFDKVSTATATVSTNKKRRRITRPSDLPLDLSLKGQNPLNGQPMSSSSSPRKLTPKKKKIRKELNNGNESLSSASTENQDDKYCGFGFDLDLDRVKEENANADHHLNLDSESGAVVLHHNNPEDNLICNLYTKKFNLDHSIKEKKSELKFKKNELHIKTEYLTTKSELVNNVNSQIASHEKLLEHLNQEIILLDAVAQKVDKELKAKGDEFAQKSAHLNSLMSNLDAKSMTLIPKVNHLNKLNKMLKEQDKVLVNINDQISEKEQEFASVKTKGQHKYLRNKSESEDKQKSDSIGLLVTEVNSALPSDPYLLEDIEEVILNDLEKMTSGTQP